MAFFTFLPQILLSGFMFPYAGMPVAAQYLAEILPLTHFLRLVRGIMLRGAGARRALAFARRARRVHRGRVRLRGVARAQAARLTASLSPRSSAAGRAPPASRRCQRCASSSSRSARTSRPQALRAGRETRAEEQLRRRLQACSCSTSCIGRRRRTRASASPRTAPPPEHTAFHAATARRRRSAARRRPREGYRTRDAPYFGELHWPLPAHGVPSLRARRDDAFERDEIGACALLAERTQRPVLGRCQEALRSGHARELDDDSARGLVVALEHLRRAAANQIGRPPYDAMIAGTRRRYSSYPFSSWISMSAIR